MLKLCVDEHSNIINIEHLLKQPAVDPNIFDEVYLGHFPPRLLFKRLAVKIFAFIVSTGRF